MRIAIGKVLSGRIVLDGSVFADGTDAYVLTRDTAEFPTLSADELAELEAGASQRPTSAT